jgi:hypothetical protein
LSIHQGTPNPSGQAVIEITTHAVRSDDFFAAIKAIDGSGLTQKPTVTLRRLA